jgi:segregation and condensation protein B
MSLKAKLEAVIYAAEEPVTLAQLAALFAAEALEWKVERAAAAAASAASDEEPEPLPLLDEGFAYLGLEQIPASETAEAAQQGVEAANGIPRTEPVAAEDGTQTAAEAKAPEEANEAGANTEGDASGASEAGADAESEAKREARARDREVRTILRELIDELIASYAADERGIEIREIAGGYRVATKPECHDAVRQFVRSLKPPLKLSLPALETLAVVAYKQPVTAPEVSEIRGVESAGTLGSLLSRKLIATAGRKPVIGRPILYKTTREFLLRFGLKDVSELPSMEEFEKMAAIELDEQAPQEEGPATTELSEEAGSEVELDDSFERTGGDSKAEPAPADGAPMSHSGHSHAEAEPGRPRQEETEVSPHEP